MTLAAGQNLSCKITFRPTAPGAMKGVLTITSNAAGSPQTVTVTGTGVTGKLAATPSTLNFGKVPVNSTSAVKTVKLKNNTDSTFTISRITNANVNFVPSQNCVGTLGTTTCSVDVTYTPSSATKETDTLTITDLPDGITRTVRLIGTGK